MLHRLRLPIAVAFTAAAGGSAFAQGTLAEVAPPGPAQLFGRSIDEVGDVDGDGRPDYVVGDPRGGAGEIGAAWLFSGKDSSLIRAHFGPGFASDLGAAVAGVGDVDLDGTPDYVVGQPGNTLPGQTAPTLLRVFSGATGVEVLTISGSPGVGRALSGMGDTNLDGYPEIVAGAENVAPAGVVRVFSGKDGTPFQQAVAPPGGGNALGNRVSGAGDVDGDGFVDFAGSAFNGSATGKGNAFVFSGKTGSVLRAYPGQSGYVADVSLAGDVDLDGRADLIVGQLGRVDVYSGATGGALLALVGHIGNSAFGVAADGAGDVDLDGRADLIVGAPVDNALVQGSGAVHVFSGATGAQLCAPHGDGAISELGTDVSGLGDVDLDGTPDVLAATWLEDRVYVLSGKYPHADDYGVGCPGFHDAVPTLAAYFTPPQESISLRVANIIPHTFAVLVFGLSQASAPLPGGCVLNVGSPLAITAVVPMEDGFFQATGIPAPAAPFTLTMQAFVADPTEPHGFSATQGLKITMN